MRKDTIVIDIPLTENKTREIRLGPQTLRGAASPLDFPSKVKVELQEAHHRLVVEFIYSMSLDEAQDRHEQNDVILFLGSRSGRVFRLEIPISTETQPQKMRIEYPMRKQLKRLKGDAEKLPAALRPSRRIAHYELLKDLLPLIVDGAQRLREAGV